jgi:multicomponent Na+:H+ antiporter subunit G
MSILVDACLLFGAVFVLVAAIGLIRMPDLPMRMHAATKAGTLGTGLLLAAVALAVPGEGVAVRALATIVFLLLTAPIAAHVIARSAYYCGEAQLWDQTQIDELADFLREEPWHESGASDPPETDPPETDPAEPARAVRDETYSPTDVDVVPRRG